MLLVVAVAALLAVPLLQRLEVAALWALALHSHAGQQWAARTTHHSTSV